MEGGTEPTSNLHSDGCNERFVCIGPANCATTWLADHLKLHRDIWLPPIQEISYLSAGFRMYRGSSALNYAWDLRSAIKRIVRNKGLLGTADKEFYQAAKDLAESPRDLDLGGYLRLFAPAGDRITGDISPSYSTMTAEQIQACLPVLRGSRIFMIARDPVDRFWSGMAMYYRARTYGDVDYGSVATAQKLFTDPMRSRYHFPTQILDRWNSVLGPDTVKVFFFDDIATRPEWALRQIVEFIGADFRKRLPLVRAGLNRKSRSDRPEISSEARTWVRSAFAEELRKCSKVFGSVGERWVDRHSEVSQDDDDRRPAP